MSEEIMQQLEQGLTVIQISPLSDLTAVRKDETVWSFFVGYFELGKAACDDGGWAFRRESSDDVLFYPDILHDIADFIELLEEE